MDTITKRIVELCKEYKLKNPNNFYRDVVDIIYNEFGFMTTPERIRKRVARYRESMNLDENFNPIGHTEDKETIQINEDNTAVSEKKIFVHRGETLDADILLEKHGFDKNKFTLVSSKSSKWTTNGNTECYSSRITVKPKTEFVWTQETVDKIMEGLRFEPDIFDYSPSYKESNLALVLPIVDLHYALYATMENARDNYNSLIAKSRFYSVISNVLSRVEDKNFEKIYFTIGNDMINCDNKLGYTTKGTPQKNCMDVEQAIVEVTDMLIHTINTLATIAPVEVIHIPSNHDYIVSFGIANALRICYQDNPNVNVDCSYKDRKYYKFGTTLMGFSHDLKVDKVNDIVSADAREMLADTSSTVYFLAHLHHEECKDVYGTDVRRLPTISSNSNWSYGQGYNAIQKSQSFIVHKEYGITEVLYTVVK